jgi:1A family penicillin-binding protein
MKLLKFLFKMMAVFIVIVGLGLFGLYIYCLFTPKIEITRNQSYYLYDTDNNMIFNNYSWVELDDISDYLINATLSTEDKHFYKHIGFDFFRIGKAIINNISSGSLSEGASTITQQYARNLYLSYDKTWKRKIEEALLAFELETHYSKEDILEGYLNTINYGGVFGIENASQYYFNKSSADLTLAEASMLAGIPQSPSNYSPLYNEELAKKRQKTVLSLMYDNDKINKEEMDEAFSFQLKYVGVDNDEITSGELYFKDVVLSELSTINNIPESILETGGIKIYTTLDSNAQMELEKSIDEKNFGKLQIAGVMIDPNDGGVLALVGGTDYNISQFNRAVSAKRQVGSTMKPFLYYAALESGFTSASSFISEKTTFNFSGSSKYTPKNYNDKYADGPLSMGAAIAYSDNIYAVKTHIFLGEENLVTIANRLGISGDLQPIPSLALGTEEISLMDMVNGYAAFANLGYRVDSHVIKRIEDNNGNILYEYKVNKVNILNESLVYILNEMLTYTYDASFIDYNYPTLISLLPKITNKYSIKSGTTNTDMWIIGYNNNAVLGLWTGYDDNSLLNGGESALHKDVWIETMEGYLKDKKNSWYEIPNNIVGVLVNPITGALSTEEDKVSKLFYFLKGTEPHLDSEYVLDSAFNDEEVYGHNSILDDNEIEESNELNMEEGNNEILDESTELSRENDTT